MISKRERENERESQTKEETHFGFDEKRKGEMS
jgi:hypothetical protein